MDGGRFNGGEDSSIVLNLFSRGRGELKPFRRELIL